MATTQKIQISRDGTVMVPSEWIVAKITSVGSVQSGSGACVGYPHAWIEQKICSNGIGYEDNTQTGRAGTLTIQPAYSIDGSKANVSDIVLVRAKSISNNGDTIYEFSKTGSGQSLSFTNNQPNKTVQEIVCDSQGRLWELSRIEDTYIINNSGKYVVSSNKNYAIARKGCCGCSSSPSTPSGGGSGSTGSCPSGYCLAVIKKVFPTECDSLLCYSPANLHMTVSNFRLCYPRSSGSYVSGSMPSITVDSGEVTSGSAPCPTCQLPGTISLTLKCLVTSYGYYAFNETNYVNPYSAGGMAASSNGVFRSISFGHYTDCYNISMYLNLGQGTSTGGGITSITCNPFHVTGTILGTHSNCPDPNSPGFTYDCVAADFTLTE